MTAYLYTLPDAVIVLLFISGSVVLMLALYLLRKYIPVYRSPRTADEIKKTDDFLLGVRTALIGMCSLVLAFSLVTVIGNFNRAEAAAAAEASLINNMDRMMVRYGHTDASELRDELLAYTKSIVEDEWPLLSQWHGSDKTRALFVPISQGVIAIQPAAGRQNVIYTEMVKKADDIAEAREARLESTSTSLASVFWLMVILTFSAVLLLTFFVELSPIRTFGFTIQMMAFAALLSVVFIFDEPFNGQTSVSPKAFVKVISAMEARDK